ncbi:MULTISPECIES: DMT family transporter [unclassified Chelatococcus]|uniref:DMT family transporter n=1 Tax=unclassified Chelatococcus TaxID=2638111 RepID=UPI001BCF17CE|nr:MULTISPECIES: DMT family transporter [unclassified Chelatococcus]MBS7700469.1 DMT family transporter [Chelatococcus sp. YT9]MBX3556265.1 DMT family transporter [Chelatococcus sp.]
MPRKSLAGIGLKLGSVSFFVSMFALIKLAGSVPTGQVVFYRSVFAMLPILAFLVLRRELAMALKTSRPLGHVGRGLCGSASIGLTFLALAYLPLSDAIMFGYAQPLFAVALGAIMLGEIVRPSRWLAVLAGLAGVAVVAWPGLTIFSGEGFDGHQAIGAGAAIGGAFATACSVLMLKALVETERSSTIVLWFSLTSTGFALATFPFGWADLSDEQTLLLALGGFAGGMAHVLVTESLRHADMSMLAPLDYTSVLIGPVLGYLLFAELPTLHMLVGGTMIASAGLFLIWTERR